MSFLSSVLSSIESGKPADIPRPVSRSPGPVHPGETVKTETQKPVSACLRTEAPIRSTSTPSAGTKRKAEEPLRRSEKTTQHLNRAIPSKAPTPSTGVTRVRAAGSTSNSRPASPKTIPPATSSKPPPKGSFADLMAKAKAVQQTAPKVGVLKHQAAQPKEKLSKSEKKRRAMEVFAMGKEPSRGARKHGPTSSSTSERPGSKSGEDLAKRREPLENSYKGTSRPAQPAYKGTAGRLPRHGQDSRGRRDPRRPRRDEYLGTDEEDEGDFLDDYDDYYSDESSDMEAGLDDVEREEELALRTARREDEEDIQRELAAKKEKLERRKKLAALASKSRR